MTALEPRSTWALPQWSTLDARLCAIGLHILTRRVVVDAWLRFVPVQHLYCCCGRNGWIRYDRSMVEHWTMEPDGHLKAIALHQRYEDEATAHRELERRMYESHPCWGPPYECISCGCSTETPCVSHRGF